MFDHSQHQVLPGTLCTTAATSNEHQEPAGGVLIMIPASSCLLDHPTVCSRNQTLVDTNRIEFKVAQDECNLDNYTETRRAFEDAKVL